MKALSSESPEGRAFLLQKRVRIAVLIECVPNFSEGRDRSKVERIARSIEANPAVRLLDLHMDPDHHRSVITFAGSPEGVEEAAVAAAGLAASLIDLNLHHGEHPRIGATDVIPFVPLRGSSMEMCAAIAHRAGERIWERHQIPVYFYEAAAQRPERCNLADIRRGGFESLRDQVQNDPSRQPDIGGPTLHPTAGATAIGARDLLIAYNVNLATDDIGSAQAIARSVRASGGGLSGVKALGLLLRSRGGRGGKGTARGQAQVSMNLTDWKRTSVRVAFERVQQEAARLSVAIESSEIVGLVPSQAFGGATPEELMLADFGPSKILENRIEEAFRN